MAIDLSTLSTREALTAVYIGYYDRAADPAGIEFWEQVVANTSLDLVAITTDFASQSETQAVHPFFAAPSESAAGAFITTLYLNLFNREPDADGLAFWTQALQDAVAGVDGALSVGEIIIAIIEGAVDVEGGTQDRTTILNKIEVAEDWTTSAEDSNIDFSTNTAAQNSAATILDGVTDQQSSVTAALATTDDFFAEDGNNGGQPGETFDLGFGGTDPVTGQIMPFDNITGTAGADRFHAEDGALVSGDQIDGGTGRDALTVFIENNNDPISARTESVESVYITNQQNVDGDSGDNNIAGFENTGVDVEIDGGRQVGVDRWEDFDSRADLVIEDARDDNDIDGTFTGDITVAMVSTDPGNVDFAVYFDDPVNTAANDDSIFIEVIDQNNSDALSAAEITAATAGNLTDAQLTEFSILVDGVRVTVELDPAVVGTAHFGADATYTDLLNAINTALDNTTLPDGSTLGDDLTASIGSTFFENIGNDNDAVVAGTLQQVFGLRIVLRSDSGVELGDAGVSAGGQGDIVVVSRDDPADVAQAISNEENIIEELIRLNVELDDVGKGSTGGDALFGAMSTGRQDGDDRTSDSIGIQQFDIMVDRSSNLQTINSTNNALEVVNITNGENSGINNTDSAADEEIGSLTVRGQANPNENRATDDAMPGGQPQHNQYGFSDVRVINGSAMVGALDINAELTEEIVEKYLDIQDSGSNGETDDVAFTYTLGANNDEFFLNMAADALNSAGTGSREDFDMTTAGGAGNDVITTNVGQSFKTIDEQGQDYFQMQTQNFEDWYANSVFTNASTFTVSGGSGDDTIWTHGWGDKNISDGTGSDAVYTDNSGVVNANLLANNIDRNPGEHDPIDHVFGAAWAFNAEATNGFNFGPGSNPAQRLSGATNDEIILAPTPATVTTLSSGTATITVSFTASGGATGTATDGVYTVTADIPVSELSLSGGNIVTDEQAFNQAIKAAINNDQTLSQMLEASDGPGNSLIVATKIDGEWLGTELDVAFTGLTVNGNTGLIGAAVNPAGYIQGVDVEFGLGGDDSEVESDSTINVAADGNNDVFVLSTNDDTGAGRPPFDGTLDDPLTDLDGTSNETLRFADGNFGSDTVVNFDSGVAAVTTGFDVMDFLAIDFDGTNFSNGAFLVADDSISLELETAGNDEASEIAVSYAGLVAGEEAIAIVYDPADDNRGTVYHVVGNGTAADNATATNVGDIELIGTDWATMTADNFA